MISPDFDVEETLAKLDINQKVKLLAGLGWWHTQPVPEHGIPSMRMSDGPNGVRGTRFFNGVPSNCFPSSTGLGSSFDVDLATKVGEALAEECRAKGDHILLAPTVNTQRSPLGGRGFESFSEDPHLNGIIAAAYINGLQSRKVAATIKHYVANDQEYQRFSISSDLSERALREIYLKPFQLAIKHSNPWALMTSYNRVNGLHASEDPRLITEILRKEWGYKGLVMSDWTGVYSVSESIKAGLDLEMPGPGVMRAPAAVVRALMGEKLFVEDIDARVVEILKLLKHAFKSGIPFDAPEETLDTPEIRALLRTAAADATVLLKNDANLLPLGGEKPPKRIAVVGPNAAVAMTSGGGSARLLSSYTVSPLEGITSAAKEIGAEVDYALGAITTKFVPLVDLHLTRDENGKAKALVEFWNEAPSDEFLDLKYSPITKEATWSTPTKSSDCFLADGVDPVVNDTCWIRYSGTFVPDESGTWQFGLMLAGSGNLFLDEKLVIDLSTDPEQGDGFLGLGTIYTRATVNDLEKGREYKLELRIDNRSFQARGSPFAGCYGGLSIGAAKVIDESDAIAHAAKVASEADVTVLVIGLNHDWESEGYDRKDMELPGATNVLVDAIIQANPNTIIVNQSGTPVAMPWINRTPTVLQAFYGGNELGNGLADILFGKVNPSGKLALTFPKRLEDTPSYPSYSDQGQEYGHILYNEGIFVGYRNYEKHNLAPLFAFGYGLSYTTFSYSDLDVSHADHEGHFNVHFTITNTGSRAGREVAQVYISDLKSSLPRPNKELKGFVKIALEPGEHKRVKVKFDREALSFYDDKKQHWVAEKGEFEVLVAAASDDIKLRGKTTLKHSVHWTGL